MGYAEIVQIDRQIDANRRELKARETFDRFSSEGWQAAWDKHPDLHARECDLFRQRGEAQIEQARIEAERVVRTPRRPREKKCPTCRGSGRVPAAQKLAA